MTLQLPPLPPTPPEWGAFQVWWQQVAENISSEIGALEEAQAATAAAIAAQATADGAVTDAAAAQTTANTANTTANTTKRNDKISASATSPTTVLSAFDAGASASITVSAHTRLYGDNTSLPGIASATLTGLAYSTTYGVYYDDTTTSNTSPPYQATITLSQAMPNFAAGRHYLGQVTTPAAGGGATTGGGLPPGGGGPYP